MEVFKNVLTITGLIFAFQVLSGQNLVGNNSFEICEHCPTTYTKKAPGELIPEWTMPTYGTVDYYNACSRFNVSVPSNMMGNIFASDGIAYSGMILLQDPERKKVGKKPLNYREYLQVQLHSPLKKDCLYLVRLWYAPADHSCFLVSNLGMLLTPKPVKRRRGVLNYEPQVEADSSSLQNRNGAWYELSDTVRAIGDEIYLTIGNFRTDSETSFIKSDLSDLPKSASLIVKENRIAYYYIDDIEVVLIKDK